MTFTTSGSIKSFLLALLALSFYIAPARGDTEPTFVRKVNTCEEYIFCTAQTATGVCTVSPASGDEVVLDTFGKWSSLTFYANESVGAFTCNVYGNNSGHDDQSGDGVLLTSTPMDATHEAISLNGGNFGHIWINCSAIATSVTITMNACPADR